jgi:hypothetical protein
LNDPDIAFFVHGLNLGGDSPPSFLFPDYPALEFDSYWCAASVIPPGESGQVAFGSSATRTASELSRVWLDVVGTGAGTFSIARFTVRVPPEAHVTPVVVPAGTGGDDPVAGTIVGWATNSSITPGCGQFAFDIVLHSTCPCPGDIDKDCDTDWSDLAILLATWGCTSPDPCYADLDGDGDVNAADLGWLLADWGCPDQQTACDEPGPSVLAVAIERVDNTEVEPGEDPLASSFDGGVTHFTFDLLVTAAPFEEWGAAEVRAMLTEPNAEFFRHSLNFGGYPPDALLFGDYPALEFDSYWMAPSSIGPGESGLPAVMHGLIRAEDELSALWFDMSNSGEGEFSIARFTVIVPAGGGIRPLLVPAGCGGGGALLGAVSGWVTDASLNPGCTEVAFDIIDCDCVGDVDGDCDTDQSDLGMLLSAWGAHPGETGWNWQADLDDDNHVYQSDLGVLLANWGCPQ